MTSAEEKCISFIPAVCELIGKVTGATYFSITNHIWAVKKERQDREKIGMAQITRKSGESLATKATPRELFSSATITRVPG